MKKLVFAFVLLSLAVLTACTTGTTGTSNLFSTKEGIISFQALAAGSLLSASNEEPLKNNGQVELMSFVSIEVQEEPVENDPLLATIEPYIALVEKFLSADNGLSVQVVTSTLEDYELMMTFETRGLLGEIQTYVIHYNLILTDEDEDEFEFDLEGIMIIDGQTYILTGEREVEEGEESIEFTAKLDDLNYVESEYSIESDEIEFEIKVVRNGEVVSETKIEIKYEEDETKIEFDFVEGESKGTYEFKYEMEGNQQVLKIEFDVVINDIPTKGEIIVSVHVDEVTGETYYQLFVDPEDDDAYEKDVPRSVDNEDTEDSEPSEPEDSIED
jgi:hypothetical protein